MAQKYQFEESRVSPTVSVAMRRSASSQSAKNRGRLDVAAEIVMSCNGGASKSKIMLMANVNSIMATQLIEKLVASGLIRFSKEDERTVLYRPTQEGTRFVQKYADLTSTLCPGLVPLSKFSDPSKAVESWI